MLSKMQNELSSQALIKLNCKNICINLKISTSVRDLLERCKMQTWLSFCFAGIIF